MALIGKSKFLFLDEPTSGLDPDQKKKIWEVLQKIKSQKTIVMSTHDLEEAESLADKLVIMSHGKVVAHDTPNNIKKEHGVGYNLIVEQRRVQDQSLEDSDFRQKTE